MKAIPQFVGIDVSKATLDVAVRPSGQSWQIDYDAPRVTHLIEQLHALEPERIVVEATGGFETTLVAALAAAALPVVVVNPRTCGILRRRVGAWPRPIASMPRC